MLRKAMRALRLIDADNLLLPSVLPLPASQMPYRLEIRNLCNLFSATVCKSAYQLRPFSSPSIESSLDEILLE